MAYISDNLSVLSYANGFTLWHYRTTDLVATVDNEGYFDEASAMLRVGDFMLINAGVDQTPTHGMLVVSSNENGSVDMSNVTPFGTINSD